MINYAAVRKALLGDEHGTRGVKDLDSPYAPAVSAEQIRNAGPANVMKIVPVSASQEATSSKERYAEAFSKLTTTFKLKVK